MRHDFDPNHWTAHFIDRHTQAAPIAWPAEEAFYAVFQRSLIDACVTPDEADEASYRVAKDPPRFADQHPKALLAAVRQVRGEQAAAARERQIAYSLRPKGDDPYEREVAAVWEAMEPAARDEWRALVRRLLRLPSLASSPRTLDMFAAVWAHNPALVPGEPETPAAPAPRRKPGEPKPLGEIL